MKLIKNTYIFKQTYVPMRYLPRTNATLLIILLILLSSALYTWAAAQGACPTGSANAPLLAAPRICKTVLICFTVQVCTATLI